MKYWLYLAAKLLSAAAIFYGLLRIAYYTVNVFLVWLIGAGVLYLIIWDQRRRCRTCLRRLIMPISTGSWSNMLTFGRPKTEWICPYGHGTLRISNLQITGSELPDWEPHHDMWQELESYDHSSK